MAATQTYSTDAAATAGGSASAAAAPGSAAGSDGTSTRHVKRRPLGLVLVLMAVLLLVLVTVSAAVGQFGIAPADIVVGHTFLSSSIQSPSTLVRHLRKGEQCALRRKVCLVGVLDRKSVV